MPRGYPNPKPAPPASNDIVRAEPAPMILIEPDNGAIRFNAYGLDLPDIVDVLRRALIHLLATDNGLRIISATIPERPAVALPDPKPSRTLKPNGRKPAKAAAGFHLIDEDEEPDL